MKSFSSISERAVIFSALISFSTAGYAAPTSTSTDQYSNNVNGAESSADPERAPSGASVSRATQSGAELGDIVVTAQKTQSSAMRTSVSMDIYSGDKARALNIRDLSSLSSMDPSVSVAGTGGSVYVGIRGIESTNQNETGDPAVTVGVDGFFANRNYTLSQSVFDLQRVEVLKGPQGTLYGRNAIGGVINFITQKPTDRFEGYASITAGNYDTFNTEGAINVPVSDRVQIRASWGTSKHGNYYNNPNQALGNDYMDSESGRLEVALQPTDRLHALLTAQYTHVGGSGPDTQQAPYVDNATQTDIVHEIPTDAYSRTWPTLSPQTLDANGYRLLWDFTYDLPWNATLKYTGGFDRQNYKLQTSNDNLRTQTPQVFLAQERPDTQNHEFRFASDPNKRLFVQAGFFYFSENSSLNSGTKRQFNNVLTQATQYIDPIVNTHSKAFFGYATYNLFDNIKLSGGIRQTWDDRKRVGIGYSYTGGILTRTSDQGGSSKSNKLTYHAGIDWTPSTETLLYFKLDTGYKAGGFNSAGVAEPFPYGPETSRVFEGGLKQQLFNRSVNFTLDGFYNTYKGYQADLGLCGTCTNTVAGTVNAGSATVWGIEGAFNAIVPVLGTASVAVNYLSAKFTDFDATYTNQAPDGGQRATIPVDLSDNYMPQSPKWSIVASLDHVFDLSEHGSIEANASMSYRARQYFDIYNWQDTSQRGYVLGNTYIQYRTADKRYSIQVYAQNITNKLYFIYAAEGGAGGSYQYAYGAPRTIGGKLTAAF